jgi:hypothetical protein
MTNDIDKKEPAKKSNFIHLQIEQDLKEGKKQRTCSYTFSSRTQRIPAYRPRKINLPEFWNC